MGTGVTPSPLPPENFEILFSAAYLIVSQLDALVKTMFSLALAPQEGAGRKLRFRFGRSRQNFVLTCTS